MVHRELKRILAKAKLGLALTAAEKRICATALEIIETIAGETDKEDYASEQARGADYGNI